MWPAQTLCRCVLACSLLIVLRAAFPAPVSEQLAASIYRTSLITFRGSGAYLGPDRRGEGIALKTILLHTFYTTLRIEALVQVIESTFLRFWPELQSIMQAGDRANVRMARELKLLTEQPPPDVTAWPLENSLNHLTAQLRVRLAPRFALSAIC